ncbi:histidine phosphatase family protein [Niallia sp. XMNu-256]|uniref:histidine phosphatase family protein n=1 Tax=Niallia sp. XMNu-256 TaxID=3082444 RepID=UPI0030D4440D
MLTLYIVRHGETEWNQEGRIQGRLNSPLTEKGKRYAQLLGERLRNVEFAEVITSPSERTLETTEIILQGRDLLYQKDGTIMEMDMGPWQGLTKTEIVEKFPDDYDCFMLRPNLYQNEGAETFIEMYKRAENFLDTVKKREVTGNLLVVSHGLFIKSLFLVIKGIPIKDFWTEPTVNGTSLSVVKIESAKMEIVFKGDMSHIKEKSDRSPNREHIRTEVVSKE